MVTLARYEEEIKELRKSGIPNRAIADIIASRHDIEVPTGTLTAYVRRQDWYEPRQERNNLRDTLLEMDPDVTKPEGDDSWKDYYQCS